MSSASIVSGLCGLVSFYVAARFLGPFVWGVWQGASLLLKYGQVAHLGVVDGMYRELPLRRGQGDSNSAREILDTTFGFTTAMALLVAASIVAGTLLFRVEDEWQLALLFTSAMVVFQLVALPVEIWFRTEHRFDIVARLTYLRGALSLVGVVLVLTFGFVGFLTAQVCLLGLFAAYGWSKMQVRPRLSITRRRLVTLVAFGLPLTGIGLATLAFVTVDRILILGYLGEASLGMYALGGLVAAPFGLVISAASGVTYPRLTERYGRFGPGRHLLPLMVLPAEGLSVLLGFLAGLAYVILPAAIGEFLPSYEAGVAAARLLLFGTVLSALFTFPSNVLLAFERQKLQFLLVLASFALSAVVVAALLSLGYGLEGAAAGASLVFLVNYCTTAAIALKLLGARSMETVDHLARAIGPLAGAFCIVVIADVMLARLGWTSLGIAAAQASLLAVAFAVPLYHQFRHLHRSFLAA